MKPSPPPRKRGARGRSTRSRTPVERGNEEPPSVISLPCYDDDGVYLGPARFGQAKTFQSPEACSMRRRLRKGALKGKAEAEDDGDPNASDRPGVELPEPAYERRKRSSMPKDGASRRGCPQLLEVGQVFGNSPQAGLPMEVEVEGRRSPSLPRDPNARTASPSSPLGTLEPPRGHRLLEHLGASSPNEEPPDLILPFPIDEDELQVEEVKAKADVEAPRKALPQAGYAPKTVADLEKLMLEWSQTPKDSEEGDFCYAKAITAYELVPHSRPEEEETWVVVGRSGLMYCSKEIGIEDWVNYKDFFEERELYWKAKRLRWVKRFQVSKFFAQWSENARRESFIAARKSLEDQLFHLKPTTQEALLWLHGFCADQFYRLSSLDADALGSQPRLLAEYGAIHQMGCERVLALVATLDHQLENGLQKWCAKMLRPQIEAERKAAERSPPDLTSMMSSTGLEAGGTMQSFLMPVPLVERSPAEVAVGFPPTTVAGRARLQRVCISIWKFLRLCNFMIEGHLRDLARCDFQRFMAALLAEQRDFPRLREWQSSRSESPVRRRISGHSKSLRDFVFQLELTTGVDLRFWARRAKSARSTLAMPRLAATPSTEEILRWILQAISSNINSLQSLRMPVCCRSLLMYGKVACAHGLASNDEEAPLWPCYELSKDVLNEGSAQELLVMLLERLNDASDVLKTIEEQLQGLVLRYCDAMTLLPNTDDPLEDLASQMVAFQNTTREISEMQESHMVKGVLLLDCMVLKKDLNKGCQDRLSELVTRSREELQAASEPVSEWLQEHQELVQADAPKDIEVFLLYLLKMEKIQGEFPKCQQKVRQMQRLETLLSDIGAQLDKFYLDMISNARVEVERFRKELVESLKRIQVAADSFVAVLQKEKPRILQKLETFILSISGDEFRILSSELFGELEADDMPPSKALLMGEHRGEDLKFSFKDEVERECILSRKEMLAAKSTELQDLQVMVENWTRKITALSTKDDECQEKFSEAQALLDPLFELWSAAANFLEVLCFCGDAKVVSFDKELCSSKCTEMSEQLEDMLPICLSLELHTRCDILQEIVHFASIFKSNDLQDVHWNQLETTVDKWNLKAVQEIRKRCKSESLTLEELVSLDLLLIRQPLEDVYQQALRQKEIRQELQALQKRWSSAQLQVERRSRKATSGDETKTETSRRRGSISLVDARAVYEGLENGDHLLEDLESSLIAAAVLLSKADHHGSLVEELLDQVLAWHKDLVLMQDILEDWLRLQDMKREIKWIYALPEVRDAKSSEVSELNFIEGWWQELLANVESKRLLTKVLLKPGFHQEILQKISDLERLKHDMGSVFAKKRNQCARLYFLVDADILELMCEAHDKVLVDGNGDELRNDEKKSAPSVMQDDCFLRLKIHKCFDGIEQLATRVGLDETLCGMRSWENEVVSFGRLKMLSKVEALISLVQDAMCKSLRSQLARATMHRETTQRHEATNNVTCRVTQEGFDRLEWAQDTRFCVQSILLCEQIYWCKAVEQALMTGDHAERELRNFRQSEAGYLMRLLDVLKGDELPLQRLRLERLAMQLLRCQEGLRQLLASTSPMTLDMLPWRLQLRLESPAALKQLRLRHMDYCAEYGFEYQGICSRMVLTPQTDRCWLIITQAFAEGHVASVHGAAGLGKSEVVKDLSLEAGVYCPTLRCSAYTTGGDVSRILVGLAMHASCWICLDAVEALPQQSYSLLLTLFFKLRSHVLAAQDEKKERDIVFEGHRIKPRKSPLALLLCSTMQEGTASSRAFADVVRPLALLPPDLHRITESQLILKGFQEEVVTHCARRVVEFFRHARSICSRPVTIHFLRTAIETAADLKASVHDLDQAAEEDVLQRAFTKVCLQSLGPTDRHVLKQLLQELFGTRHRHQPTKGGWFDGARRLSTRRASFFKEVADGSSTSDSGRSRKSQEGYRAHSTFDLDEEEESEETEDDNMSGSSEEEEDEVEEEEEMTQWMGLLMEELERCGFASTNSYLNVFRQLRMARGSFPGTILCGPSGVGKTTVLRCMMEAEKRASVLQESLVPEMMVYFPQTLPPEILRAGGSEAMNGSVLSKLLSGRHKVICFDGSVDSWVDSLHGLLDRTGHQGHRQLNNMSLALDTDTRMIFETDSLAQASPSTLCRCCTVQLPMEAVGPLRLLRCWSQQFLSQRGSWLPVKAQEELRRLLELFPEAVALTPRADIEAEALLLCSTLTRLLEAQLRNIPRQSSKTSVLPGQLTTGRRLSTSGSMVMHSKSTRESSFTGRSMHQNVRAAGVLSFDYNRYVQSCFAFCLTWTIGIGFQALPQHRLITWLQAKIPDFHLPRGCHRLTDVFVDSSVQDSEGSYFSPWFTQLPAASHEVHQEVAVNVAHKAVTTVHGMSFAYVALNLLTEGQHVLFSGTAGVGKTFTASSVERSLRSLQMWTTIGAVWSRRTSLHHCRSLLQSCATKCRPGRRHLIAGEVMIHIEDLNLPKLPQPFEALRAFLDRGPWIKSRSLDALDEEFTIPGAQGVRLLTTTGPLHAVELRGRSRIPHRLQRHFSELQVSEPPEDDVRKILQTLSRHVLQVGSGETLEAAFTGLTEEPLQGLKLKPEDALASASLQLFKLMKDVKATPTQTSTFSLRHLGQLMEGIARACPWQFTSRRQLAQLWTHESMRIYEDRITSEAGRHTFREHLAKLLPTHFDLELSLTGTGPIFGIEMDTLRYQNFDEKDMNPMQTFREVITEHNAQLDQGTPLPFLPFAAMVHHTLHIARVMALPATRFVILQGPNNCGKRSACLAACCFFHANCCDVVQKITTAGTAKEEFCALMRECIISAGKHGRHQLILVRDTPCYAMTEDIMELILDSLHRFLRHGSLLNLEDLHNADDVAALQAVPEAAWRPLIFGALSVTSMRHLRDFPGFVSSACIQCFLPFTEDALQGIITAVTGIDRDLSDKNSKFGPRQIAEAVTFDEDHLHFIQSNEAFCHKILAGVDLLPQIFAIAPKASGASLRDFLDMLNSFVVNSTAEIIKCRAQRERMIQKCNILTQVIEVVDDSLGPLKEWMEKSRAMKVEVAELQTRLSEIQEEVKQKQAIIEKDEAEKHRAEAAVKVSNQVVALKTARIRDAKEQVQMKTESLTSVLHPDAVQELNSRQELVMVSELLKCLCLILDLEKVRDSWCLPVDGSLPGMLSSIDPDTVSKEASAMLEDFDLGNELEDLSHAARVIAEDLVHFFQALADLLRALKKDQKAEEVLFEEEERLAEAKAHLTLERDALRDLQQQMSEAKLAMHQSRTQLQEAEDVLYDNREVVSRAERYHLPAQAAIDVWTAERHEYDLRFDAIPARSTMMAAIISFLGPLDAEERQSWLNRVSEVVAASGAVASVLHCPVPMATMEELENELATKAMCRTWHQQGLVEASYLSAALAKVSMNWPFLLDPQMHAKRWLVAELGRETNFFEAKACDPDLYQKIQRAKDAECSIIIRDCDTFPPVLVDLKSRPKRGTGSLLAHEAMKDTKPATDPSLADKSPRLRRLSRKFSSSCRTMSTSNLEVEATTRSFHLYMTSSSHRSELMPVTLQHCSVINFALTLDGFTQVFLDILLQSQVPALAEEFTRLYSMQSDDSALQKAENKMLQYLEEHRGASILEGEDCIMILALYQDALNQHEATNRKFKKDFEDFHRCRKRLGLFAQPLAVAAQSAAVMSKLSRFYAPSIPQVSTKLVQLMTGGLVSKVADMGDRTREKEPVALRRAMILEILQLLARPMDNVHRLPLVFLTAVGCAHAKGALTDHQLDLFWEGQKAVDRIASELNAEIQQETARTGQVPHLINPRMIKSSPDRKTFTGEKWELINFLPHVFPGFNGLPQDIVVNIAQWRQALSRPPTGELFFACAHFPEPWQRYRKEVTVESEDGSQGAVDDLEEADEDEEEGEEKEENGKVQTMSFPTRQKDMNYDGLTSFEQLMLLKVIQPESVIRAVQGFIAEVLDESLLVMQPISILQAMEDLQEKEGKFRALLLRCDSLSSQCPSIYDELKVLVEQRKATKEGRRAQLVRCSPLQSIEQVKEAAHEGATVLITELQLAGQEFLAELELLMEELCLPATGQGNITVDAHHSSTQHVGTHHTRECFRLVLSFDGDLPPMSIMQMCQKVAVFPPVGVRGRLRQLTGTVSFERSGEMEGESLLPWSRTLFSLCLFHSVLAVRYQRYQCCFQSTAYDIAANWSFKSAVHFLEQETSSQELMQHPPWEAITHWIRTVTHGGHLGDCWHRQQIYALIERFLGPAAEALKRDCAEGLEAEDMSELELQRARNLCQYLDFQLNDHTPPGKEAWRYLDQLPEAPAELFGLHPREDRVFDSHSSIAMLATLAQIRPPSEDVAAAAAVELKQHLKVEEMLNELPKSSEKLKQELLKPSKARSRRSLERSEQQDPFHGDPPIAQVLRQELWSLLELVAFLRADLQQIRDMLVSKLELSPEMHEVLRNIFNNTVPTRWRQRAFLSCRPLQGWFIGLKIRLQWLHAAWSERGHEPLCHRLDFYWRPRQLLLSYLRVAAQKDNVALEAYSFRHKVVDRMEEEEDVQDRPAVGLYCVGLYLYGAQWDRKRAILAECRADELFYRMPVIHFIPMADFKPKLEKTYAVPFYQAERQCRITGDGEDSNYITEVLLHSNNSPKDWLLRSVALYCELMA